MTEVASVKPVRYMPTGAVLLFPPPVPRDRLFAAGKLYVNGWKRSATLRSSYPTALRLAPVRVAAGAYRGRGLVVELRNGSEMLDLP